MRLLRSAAVAAALLYSALGAAPPSLAQSNTAAQAPRAAAKAQWHDAFRLQPGNARAAQVRLEALPPAAIDAVKRSNSASLTKRLEIGVGRAIEAVDQADSRALTWSAVDGGVAAHWQLTSAQAKALRVALDIGRLPAGAELRFAGLDRLEVVYGPFTASDVLATGSRYWSPVLEGDTARVEVFVPAGQSPFEVAIAIRQLSHLFVSPADPKAEQLAKASGFCQVDFICRAAGDSSLDQTGRSVARMTFTVSGGGTSMCTGTLLNPSDGSFTPYFYSAAHCISTQASASTLTTHWFYENAACGGGGLSPSYVQVPGGSTLLHANTASDALLVRLNASPPSTAIYAGWDAATVSVGSPMTAIHHPEGDVKKVSLGSVGGLGPASGFDTGGDFIRIKWNSISTGVVEPGSSGSGIFSGNSSAGYRFRGGLLGGPSSCTASASDLYDYYSRFDQVYVSISQYLNPGSQQALGPNILTNPGFESGSRGWTESSSGGAAIITNDANLARSGSWYAWLGGNVSVTDSLYQDVTVPTGGRLQFWYRITTNETTSSAYDTLNVALASTTSGVTLTTVASFSNLTTTTGWVQSSPFDLSAYAGQTVRLRFNASNDFSDFTSFRIDDVSVAGTLASASANYTALWWNSSESGWGINVNQQGDIAFATLFTYDSSGAPLWLVMSGGMRQGTADTFSGPLYRTTGPAFNSIPFTPIGPGNLTQVGTMTLAFSGSNAGTLTYTVNGVSVTKAIEKQIYGARAATCTPTTGSRSGATNYQDLWWNESESGWGINITHQGDILFGTLFTYGSNGQGLWLVMSAGARQPDGSYMGDLYRTGGPAFNAQPWSPISVTRVGSMRLRFSNGENATLEYSVDGASVTKSITRQVFSSPLPLCSS